ncbi:MAG TPA: adenylate/guanylate cyclase domain-containing protein [Spirochaetia bacterium]|nr:adenylate/guanylate cyclase domain-containing protein [Spirochaetia bacterium]HBI38677.1 adenylate/guanylate cyclase domain-containing protein [Spirochaetia bacterium]
MVYTIIRWGTLVGKFKNIFGSKIDNTRIIPITLKITLAFTLFLITSNLITNYINITFNRVELVNLMKELMVKDLKELYNYANIQKEIFTFNNDTDAAIDNMMKKGISQFKNKKSIAAGYYISGKKFFQSTATGIESNQLITDTELFKTLLDKQKENATEGGLTFQFDNKKYIGVYKYNPAWDMYIIRGEQLTEFYSKTWVIFRNISIIIFVLSLICAVTGIFILQYILRFVEVITQAIIAMIDTQKMDLIDLKGATNDDITFLGTAFNSLSSSINNLLSIFLKFVNKDIALKAYKDKVIKLEGTQKELTILFSDIKSFTFMTETLGIDIIKLLNLHYERAIHKILNNNGVIGSIIGDALLAVFGAFDENKPEKSSDALKAAYQIQMVAESLRQKISEKEKELLKERGYITAIEKRIFQAVMLEVGVGIDGGSVFYGNIGSSERMTNTVIGDNVNSASRLEGLTRIYKISVICSEYIMNDYLKEVDETEYYFLHIDIVQVKGKTEGKKVYWPIKITEVDSSMRNAIDFFTKGLQLYFEGDWEAAYSFFKQSALPVSNVFIERTANNKSPDGWNGIWTMTTK